MGRPTLCTPERTAQLAVYIEGGNYAEVAAALVGIDATTFSRWLKRGARELRRVGANNRRRVKKSEQPFVDFCQAIKRADAHAETADILAIRSDKSWQSKAWRLERKHPNRWARRNEVVVGRAPPAPDPDPDSQPDRFADNRAELAPLIGDRDALAALRIVVGAIDNTTSDSSASNGSGGNGAADETPGNGADE